MTVQTDGPWIPVFRFFWGHFQKANFTDHMMIRDFLFHVTKISFLVNILKLLWSWETLKIGNNLEILLSDQKVAEQGQTIRNQTRTRVGNGGRGSQSLGTPNKGYSRKISWVFKLISQSNVRYKGVPGNTPSRWSHWDRWHYTTVSPASMVKSVSKYNQSYWRTSWRSVTCLDRTTNAQYYRGYHIRLYH